MEHYVIAYKGKLPGNYSETILKAGGTVGVDPLYGAGEANIYNFLTNDK
ncbi:hypothetical protein [Bacillus sp. Y1]|jgi:hypothetical protein|nr:hypothetical protein [Bacillus sp. Y1]